MALLKCIQSTKKVSSLVASIKKDGNTTLGKGSATVSTGTGELNTKINLWESPKRGLYHSASSRFDGKNPRFAILISVGSYADVDFVGVCASLEVFGNSKDGIWCSHGDFCRER